MNQNNIEIIKNILINDLNIGASHEDIGLEDGLQTIFDLDSIAFIELRFQCEKLFNISISDENFIPENFKNIKSLLALIGRLQQ